MMHIQQCRACKLNNYHGHGRNECTLHGLAAAVPVTTARLAQWHSHLEHMYPTCGCTTRFSSAAQNCHFVSVKIDGDVQLPTSDNPDLDEMQWTFKTLSWN